MKFMKLYISPGYWFGISYTIQLKLIVNQFGIIYAIQLLLTNIK